MAGFDWDAETYTEGNGGEFVKEAEFLQYVASGSIIQITGIRDGVSANYGNKPQWLLDFVDDEGEAKTKSFDKGNAERDSRMSRVRSTIEQTGEPIPARFIKVGRRNDIAGA